MKKLSIGKFYSHLKRNLIIKKWEINGRPSPPPHAVKQKNIIRHAKKYNIHTLIETGTYLGEMVDAMKNYFEVIYSIELSNTLYTGAIEKFRNHKHIKLIQGDSGKELEAIVPKLTEPAIFWLDGHFSAGITAKGIEDTPIREELLHILQTNIKHVILIDDARLFGTDPNYPTIGEIAELVLSKTKNAKIEVAFDAIIITPPLENSLQV